MCNRGMALWLPGSLLSPAPFMNEKQLFSLGNCLSRRDENWKNFTSAWVSRLWRALANVRRPCIGISNALTSYMSPFSKFTWRHSWFWDWWDYYKKRSCLIFLLLFSKFSSCSLIQRNSCERQRFWCVRTRLLESKRAFQKSKGKALKNQSIKLIHTQ